jgi:hypothetical protein
VKLPTFIATFFYCALFGGYALAQGQQLEIKGFKLGISFQEAQTQLDNINRDEMSPEKWKAEKKHQTLRCEASPDKAYGDRKCSAAMFVANEIAPASFVFA